MHIEVFQRGESVRYLLQRAGKTDRESSALEVAAEQEAAEWLASQLGDLPLALELAASYCRARGMSIKEYLRLFQQSSQDIREGIDGAVHGSLRLSLKQAQKQSEHCESLLTLCSFLASEDLPLDLLLDRDQELPDMPELAPLQDDQHRQRALESVCEYSLLERSDEKVSIHRVVQDVLYNQLAVPARRRWAVCAIVLINDHLASEVNSNLACWPIYSRLLTHGLAAIERAKQLNLSDEPLSRVLNQLGQYLHLHAQFKEAEPLMRRALAIFVASLSSKHPSSQTVRANYHQLLATMNLSDDEIDQRLREVAP